MEELRTQINSKCVLTCTRCSVKESCPFYDQNEVIKMSCTPMETIDIYLKDNELELIDEDSIEVEIPEGGSFSIEDLKKTHKEYSDVLHKRVIKEGKSIDYDGYDIESLKQELKRAPGLRYLDYVRDEMTWILGGRYGTVEAYPQKMKSLIGANYADMEDQISPYKYCYNALFIKVNGNNNRNVTSENDKVPYMQEDSYIDYRVSDNTYEVKYELGAPGQKKEYKAKVKLKMPYDIKMLADSNSNDDVYLVSDDTKDASGNLIDPVIYLGKVGNLQYTFDVIEDKPSGENSEHGAIDPSDPNIYASDVAQWCMNYIKGHCVDDPCGSTDVYSNMDQYWMPTVYKKIYKDNKPVWAEFPGRRRAPSGFQEPVIDAEDFDDILAISGHPVINTYYDFIRKVSIRIYDPSIENEYDRWLIPWVNENLLSQDSLDNIEEYREKQRSVLPLMKTNLRLVVVKT